MKTIYVIIGHDSEAAWIDDDCVFNSFKDAKDKVDELRDEAMTKGRDMSFTLEEIQIKED